MKKLVMERKCSLDNASQHSEEGPAFVLLLLLSFFISKLLEINIFVPYNKKEILEK